MKEQVNRALSFLIFSPLSWNTVTGVGFSLFLNDHWVDRSGYKMSGRFLTHKNCNI